jgi:hypothetical protein
MGDGDGHNAADQADQLQEGEVNIKWIETPPQYEEFIENRELLISAWAGELVPIMGELGLKFIRFEGPKVDVLIARK